MCGPLMFCPLKGGLSRHMSARHGALGLLPRRMHVLAAPILWEQLQSGPESLEMLFMIESSINGRLSALMDRSHAPYVKLL